ncbi:HlyC/CorC family transporter [Frankia sp. CNm7]|uniref:HlyC/CorC family transporter n=1 Tax=Frankia nepalensis TaxID=1836974 RepID=A0A937RAW8_9ACTN|nr:hemolysin family protein [Frankia nepalensis]MBL7501927.1 HlyC/CorC family transporter [Frankia nepalensis]MBL7514528.1 HlyC/CorC family transporter [Frankia nepalensis]MBL7524186.1 HlyC/CorC family transporter [Frankia nepalensis]MBL7628803.1 HlyC/CorC family transporter [Frankia nepalensis]
MVTALSLLLGLLVVLLITLATGYFVAQEFAYMAVDRSRLKVMAEAGDTAARRALKVTRRTSFMLSGAQLGITVTGLLVGYVAEPLIGSALGDVASGVGLSTAVGVALGTVLALMVSTFIQMIFGELFPKNLAIARPEPIARRLAWSTLLYLRIFGWLVWVFDQASTMLLRLLGIQPVHDLEHAASARDLEHIVAESRERGDLPVDLSLMLDRILDFPRRDVEHAMIPRSQVDVVERDLPVGEVRILMSAGHSRYPVVDDDGQVAGVIHLADVLDAPAPDIPARELARPALVISTLMRLPAALAEMTGKKEQLACVVDEFGGFAGIMTIEDLAEEFVGEITDEHDAAAAFEGVNPIGDGAWLVPGGFHVDEVERTLGHQLPPGDYETIAGLVISVHGALPRAGTVVDVTLPPDPGELALRDEAPRRVLRAIVMEVDNHVPAAIRLELRDEPAHDQEG